MAHTSQFKKILLALLLALLAFTLMIPYFTAPQSFLIAIIVLMVTLWTNEGLPLAVVSLLPIILFPACGILETKATSINYANPIIYLFLGGFMIAIAVEKTGLHKYIAHQMLRLFPNTARGMLFALIITSGTLSAILSNTTTTLLLLPIALFLTTDQQLKMRLALGIAYGASIGGILTPIGTPPNLILMGVMEEMGMRTIPFIQWMLMVAPLVLLMFGVAGYLLSLGLSFTPLPGTECSDKLTTQQKKVLGLIIALIALLFLNAPIKPYYDGLGLSEPGILLGAGLLLFTPPCSILDWMGDKAQIPYRIMFLFGAGFAIAAAFSHTGMAKEIATLLSSFTAMPFILFLLVIATMVTFTTEVTSNTALISIILPILYSVAQQSGINHTLIMMVATICASYAFMLPIATPPNAIAMSSGAVTVHSMIRYGILFNLIAIALTVSIAYWYWMGWLS